MARPVKWRRIEHIPSIPYFIPSASDEDGVPANTLKLEELEAVRLKDLEGLEQSECAERWVFPGLPFNGFFYLPGKDCRQPGQWKDDPRRRRLFYP